MIRFEDVYQIGKLGKPHGVKGELTFMFEDDVFDTTDCDYLVLDMEGILVPFFLQEYRFKSNEVVLVKFEGVDTQERARELTGHDVYFPRHLAEEQETASWAEIIGYRLVNDRDGIPVGVIRSVDDTTVNVLFEVDKPNGHRLLVPASEELITAIDKGRREITLTIPEGLMELD